MPVTKVRSKWSSGDLIFENTSGTEIIRLLADGTFKVNTILLDAATLDELATLGGLTASVAELNLADGSVAGTAVASKLLALGANKNVDILAVADGGFALGAGAGTPVTSTAAELNILDGVTATASEINALDDSAAFADGLSRVRVATATYDFAVDGGAISAIDLGVTLPDNAIILDGVVDIITTLTTAGADAGTIALHAEGADDLVTAIAVADGTNPWDAGLHAIKPLGTSTTAIKLTAARAITATIAGQTVTAGKFVAFLRYVLSA